MRIRLGPLESGRLDCSRWELARPSGLPAGPGADVDDYSARVMPRAGESDGDLFHRASDRLLRYDVFPPRLMRATLCTPDGRVAASATIVQRVRLGPGISLEAGVRVADVWRRDNEVGFRYVTLAGHPERGEEFSRCDATQLGCRSS